MAPLDGLRVIDLTRVVAGPFCTMMLGDMGAEVLKIEEPQHGDDSRAWAPFIQNFGSFYLASAQAFHRGQGTTENATARRTFYFSRSKILYARKHFGALGACAVMVVTLTLEPFARMLARPRSAGEILRAFENVWKELPKMLRA